MLVRSELLRRYPDAVIYATRPGPPPEERHPIFVGGFAPDVRYFGFDIPATQIRDWSIVIQEHPTAPRFGVEVGEAPAGAAHLSPRGDNAADVARQLPPDAGAGDAPRHHPARAGVMALPYTDLGPILAGPFGGTAALDAELGPSDLPLALFPVRLETRFFAAANGMAELRVRVYPDKVHIDSHDPALDADEAAWGRRFWELWRQAARRGGGPARRLAHAGEPPRPRARRLGRPRADADSTPATARRGSPTSARPPTIARRALLRLLPERWIATAWARGGPPVTVHRPRRPARPRRRPRPPDAAPPPSDDRAPAIDEGMRWMVDFDRAEKVGMALRLPLPSTLVDASVDLLLVTGVRRGDGAAALAAQLDAHRYADGLAFVPAGTPTNNTAAGRSGFAAPDPLQAASFEREWRPPAPAPASAAARATRALGVAAFDRLADGADSDETAARAMATALWPATWGYYLAQMIGFDAALTPAGRDWAAAHARDHLRPGGPLPDAALRPPALRRPAGHLPRRLDRARRRRASPRVLAALRDRVWRPAAAAAPAHRPQRRPRAPTSSTCSRTGPLATGFRVRGLMGQHFLQHLRAFLGEDLDPLGFWTRLVQLAPTRPPPPASASPPPSPTPPTTPPPAPSSPPSSATPPHIAALLAADPDALAAPLPADPRARSCRRSCATPSCASTPRPPPASLGDPALAPRRRARRPRPRRPARRHLVGDPRPRRRRRPGPRPPRPGRRPRPRRPPRGPRHPRRPRRPHPRAPPRRARLDATSHRLDAWITSLATRRLADPPRRRARGHRRSAATAGSRTSARPRPAPPRPRSPTSPAPSSPRPATRASSTPPRSTRRAPPRCCATPTSPTAPPATPPTPSSSPPPASAWRSASSRASARASPSARCSATASSAACTRRTSTTSSTSSAPSPPSPAPPPPPGSAASSSTASPSRPAGTPSSDALLAGLPLGTDPRRRDKTVKALDALRDAVDAAADAVNAEAAFQMVRGNLPRAAASLDAISSGQAPPPELGFVATPRTGTAVTHRVAMLFAAEPGPTPPGWAATSPRAAADPVLAAWAGRLLGPATGVGRDASARPPTSPSAPSASPPSTSSGRPAAPTASRPRSPPACAPPPASPRAASSSTAASPTSSSSPPAPSASSPAPARSTAPTCCRSAPIPPAASTSTSSPPAPPPPKPPSPAPPRRLRAALAAPDGDPGPAMTEAAAFGIPQRRPGRRRPTRRRPAPSSSRSSAASLPQPADEPPDEAARRDRILARLRAVFGPGFLALPRFRAANAADLAASRADAARLHRRRPARAPHLAPAHGARPAAPRPPLPPAPPGRAPRPPPSASTSPSPRSRTCPASAGPRLDAPEGSDRAISLLLQGAPADLAGPLAGLLVDEWTEVVPSRPRDDRHRLPVRPARLRRAAGDPARRAAGDRPALDGRRAQPRPRSRPSSSPACASSSPAALGAVAHYLPAACLAFNLAGDAVSTDLNPLAP